MKEEKIKKGVKIPKIVFLLFIDPPEIAVERSIVYTGDDKEATLVCIVHGETQPEVLWYRDTMQIDQTERHIIESRGARHSLIIRKIKSNDFGNYTCAADNQLGKTKKVITLTGRPAMALFRSPPISQWKDKYNLTWVVDSHIPIEEYKLYYRPFSVTQDDDLEIKTQREKLLQQQQQQQYGRRGSGYNVRFFFLFMV